MIGKSVQLLSGSSKFKVGIVVEDYGKALIVRLANGLRVPILADDVTPMTHKERGEQFKNVKYENLQK